MELIKTNGYIVTYQRQGNDRNGKTIYILNFFDEQGLYNCNFKIIGKGYRKDKYGNIKTTSYNINDTIQHIIKLFAQYDLEKVMNNE